MQQPRRTSHGVAERQLRALKGRGVCAQTGAATVSPRAGVVLGHTLSGRLDLATKLDCAPVHRVCSPHTQG